MRFRRRDAGAQATKENCTIAVSRRRDRAFPFLFWRRKINPCGALPLFIERYRPASAPFVIRANFLSNFNGLPLMTPILKISAVLGVTLIAGTAQSLESLVVAKDDSARAQRHQRAPAQEEALNGSGMQALCREILVDTDEGYGVTNREPRIICDDLR
jgi:hypothetical protein